MDGDRPKVLLIDDDRVVLSMYGDYLKKHGISVVSAESGEDGLSKIIEDDKIDLVVTDIMMARMSGWALLDYIREELELDEVRMPVIVMSAVESVDLDMEYMRHGANDWVAKPIRPMAKLVHKIRKLLGLGVGLEDSSDDDDNG